MQLKLEREGDTLTAYLTGELDHHTAAPIRRQIDTAVLSCRCPRLVLDLAGVTFMDSSGIGLMMGRYRLMNSLGGVLRIEQAPPRIEKMIHLAGLDKLPIWDETKEGKCRNETHQ